MLQITKAQPYFLWKIAQIRGRLQNATVKFGVKNPVALSGGH